MAGQVPLDDDDYAKYVSAPFTFADVHPSPIPDANWKPPPDDPHLIRYKRGFSVFPYPCKVQQFGFKPEDFSRINQGADESYWRPDNFILGQDSTLPRGMTDHAAARLRLFLKWTLPEHGNILDLCCWWTSNYPDTLKENGSLQAALKKVGIRIYGLGLLAEELAMNDLLKSWPWRRLVWDLNKEPDFEAALPKTVQGKLDMVTCCAGLEYLTQPLEVLTSLRKMMRDGGKAHFVVTSMCYQGKAIRCWNVASASMRRFIVADMLFQTGWKEIHLTRVSHHGDMYPSPQDEQEPIDEVWVVTAMKQEPE